MSQHPYHTFLANVKQEIFAVLQTVSPVQIDHFISLILSANRIVVCGAGRVGYVSKAFAMRLKHLGFDAYSLGDSNLPSLSSKDLLIVNSGSGETQTIFDLTQKAASQKVIIATVTASPQSRIAKLSSHIIKLQAPTKTQKHTKNVTIQPMTTLNEQCLWLFYDILVLLLMQKTGKSEQDLWKAHSILE